MTYRFERTNTQDSLEGRIIRLEVSQNEIASAVGLDKSTVRNYITGYSRKSETLELINRYLNSREYYKGYVFKSRDEFAGILNNILETLKGKINATEFGKLFNFSAKKISNLRIPNFEGSFAAEKRITDKLDIKQQYDILNTAYDLCADDKDYVAEEYSDLREELADLLAVYYPMEIKTDLSKVIDSSVKAYEKLINEPKFALSKIAVKIKVPSRVLKEMRLDDNYLMDLEERCRIVNELYELFADTNACPDALLSAHRALAATPEILREVEFLENDNVSFLGCYPPELQALILEFGYAFVEGTDHSSFEKYIISHHGGELPWNYELPYDIEDEDTLNEIYTSPELYKYHIQLMFDKLPEEDKELAAELVNNIISENSENSGFSGRCLKFGKDRSINYNFSCNIDFAVMADIDQMILITAEYGILSEHYKTSSYNVRSAVCNFDKGIFKSRRVFLESIKNYSEAFSVIVPEILKSKLDFDSLDWYFWSLMTKAVYLDCGLEKLIEFVSKDKENI